MQKMELNIHYDKVIVADHLAKTTYNGGAVCLNFQFRLTNFYDEK